MKTSKRKSEQQKGKKNEGSLRTCGKTTSSRLTFALWES